jgi:hypothetical protein
MSKKNEKTSVFTELDADAVNSVTGGAVPGHNAAFDIGGASNPGNKFSPTPAAGAPFTGFGNPNDSTTPYGTYQHS